MGGGGLEPSVVEMNDDAQLGVLNNRPGLASKNFLNQFIIDDENNFNIFNNIQISSTYFNNETFVAKCRSQNEPIIISLNIQSLRIKFNELVAFITCLSSKNMYIDVIALTRTAGSPVSRLPEYSYKSQKITPGRVAGSVFIRGIILNLKGCEKLCESLTIKVKFGRKK